MRSSIRPPYRRACSRLKIAVRAPPTCRKPVGDGAKRSFIGRLIGRGVYNHLLMRRQRGFSLAEVLVGVLILGIVVSTSLAVFVERKKRLQQAREVTLAYQVLANE